MIREIITQRMVKFLVYETFSHIFISAELWYLHLSEMFGAYAFLAVCLSGEVINFLTGINKFDTFPILKLIAKKVFLMV